MWILGLKGLSYLGLQTYCCSALVSITVSVVKITMDFRRYCECGVFVVGTSSASRKEFTIVFLLRRISLVTSRL